MANPNTIDQDGSKEKLTLPADVPELYAIVNCHLYEKNPYRILGVSVGSSAREITRRIDHLKMENEMRQTRNLSDRLGVDQKGDQITEDAIREAGHLLRSPAHRFLYEFFWLWPESYPFPGNDENIARFLNGTPQSIKGALDAWRLNYINSTETECDPDKRNLGHIALHNLAIAAHYLAFAETGKGDLEKAWHSSIRSWKSLIDDEQLWDLVAIRIQRMDDPQITTGLARRVRNKLPYALATVHAAFVLEKASNGNDEEANFHGSCISAWGLHEHQEDQLLHAASKLVRERITSFAENAKRRAQSDAGQAIECANALLKDTERDFKILVSLFGETHEAVIELSDEVVTVSLNAAIAHQRETGNDEALLKLCVFAANKLRTSELISNRLEAVKKRATENIYFEREIQPILKRIKEVASIASSIERFDKLQRDVVPLVASLDLRKGEEGYRQCRVELALAFRSLSIKANNEDRYYDLALSAINAGIKFASDPDLLKQLERDFAQLKKNQQERESFNVRLKIRNTDVEINATKCRCDNKVLAPHQITGVRWGIYVHSVNGITSHYYTIWVFGLTTLIEIECKPLLRNIDDAQRDFGTIVRGLYFHVVPDLVERIVNAICSKRGFSLGPLLETCNQDGIKMSKGSLFWKEEAIIPYTDLNVTLEQGYVKICSISRPEFRVSYSQRECWNAVIFEEIVAALIRRKTVR